MSASSNIRVEEWGWTPPGFPEVTHLTQPFWDALRRHELVIQRCKDCKEYQWYPRPQCIHCGSMHVEWTKIEGKGTIYSYAIINMVVGNSPLWGSEVPFAIGLIELEEGPRMYGKMTDCELTDIKIGLHVKATFLDLQSNLTVPAFRPIE